MVCLLGLAGLVAGPVRAATFVVTKEADTDDGSCDADCSLREAILAANALAGADQVVVPAGRFVLDTSGEVSDFPQFWGVLKIETNFNELEQFGIFIEGSALLQINTTNFEKTETLTLKGIGDNDEDVTREFVLPPTSFAMSPMDRSGPLSRSIVMISSTTGLFRTRSVFRSGRMISRVSSSEAFTSASFTF